MLLTVTINATPSGEFTAAAPDLAGCILVDADEGRLLARMRLAIEGRLVDGLLAGQPVPVPCALAAWRADPHFAGARFVEMHMNLDHLGAVARHQRGR